MPRVVKQVGGPVRSGPARAAPPANGVASRIGAIAPSKLGRLKCSLYGGPKTGKTRLACTFPKPLLLVGAEDGTASVVGTAGVDFVMLERTDELTDLVEGPVRDGRWKTVVLDNATKMRELRIVELFAAMGMEVPDRKPFMYADKVWKSVWVQCAQDMRNFLSKLLDLPRVMPLNVVVIAQEAALYQEDAGTGAASDLIKPKVSSALGDRLANWLNAECDYICQTLIRSQTKEAKGVGGATRTVPTGKSEYCLRVGPHEVFQTGFRLPLNAPPLPDFVVDPTYEKLAALISGKRVE